MIFYTTKIDNFQGGVTEIYVGFNLLTAALVFDSQVRDYTWQTTKSTAVVAIDLEYRPFMDHRDSRGSSGGMMSYEAKKWRVLLF